MLEERLSKAYGQHTLGGYPMPAMGRPSPGGYPNLRASVVGASGPAENFYTGEHRSPAQQPYGQPQPQYQVPAAPTPGQYPAQPVRSDSWQARQGQGQGYAPQSYPASEAPPQTPAPAPAPAGLPSAPPAPSAPPIADPNASYYYQQQQPGQEGSSPYPNLQQTMQHQQQPGAPTPVQQPAHVVQSPQQMPQVQHQVPPQPQPQQGQQQGQAPQYWQPSVPQQAGQQPAQGQWPAQGPGYVGYQEPQKAAQPQPAVEESLIEL